MGQRQVSGTRVIAAKPEEIFDLLTDPARHPELDGSGTVVGNRKSSHQRLELGSTFGMDMKIGASYKILNTVVEFEENRLIAWRHFHGHRWRWQLEPMEGGTKTKVTETFDWGPARWSWLFRFTPYPRVNRRNIEKTLDNLQDRFAERASSSGDEGDDGGSR
ncbi:SRPBCC family protein [Natronoglycomyces albus]|uniref:SRPBCC family protein n=1 Tax=Natronoglycomyces albus TaxID=2811108 RepID=A0A895XKF6_9ACTN|nr:SRPBCC family protein [Natronoglycomyces albus]QSB04043.1 SRPBCC family protein [Natronoglycomyces albus]